MWVMPRSRPRRKAATAEARCALSMYQVPWPITATSRFVGPNRRLSMLAFLRRGPRLLACPAEQIDDPSVERRDVVGIAARHEVAVGDDRLIHPFSPGVPEIGLQRRPRGDAPSMRRAGLDHRPWSVADRC